MSKYYAYDIPGIRTPSTGQFGLHYSINDAEFGMCTSYSKSIKRLRGEIKKMIPKIKSALGEVKICFRIIDENDKCYYQSTLLPGEIEPVADFKLSNAEEEHRAFVFRTDIATDLIVKELNAIRRFSNQEKYGYSDIEVKSMFETIEKALYSTKMAFVIDGVEFESKRKIDRDYSKGQKPARTKVFVCVETGKTYDKILDAIEETGVSRIEITNCIKNKDVCDSKGNHWITRYKIIKE